MGLGRLPEWLGYFPECLVLLFFIVIGVIAITPLAVAAWSLFDWMLDPLRSRVRVRKAEKNLGEFLDGNHADRSDLRGAGEPVDEQH